jgi:hypothetical protein
MPLAQAARLTGAGAGRLRISRRGTPARRFSTPILLATSVIEFSILRSSADQYNLI